MKVKFGTTDKSFQKDLDDSFISVVDSYENMVAAGYESLEAKAALDRVLFIHKSIQKNGVEWCTNNLNLDVSAIPTPEASEEGLKDLSIKFWEKIKAFFAKIAEWVRRAYDAITSSDIKTAKYCIELRKVCENSNVDDAVKKVNARGLFATFSDMRKFGKEYVQMATELTKCQDKLEDHIKKLQDVLGSNGFNTSKRDELLEDARKLNTTLEDLKEKVYTIRDRITEMRSKSFDEKTLKDMGYTKASILEVIKISMSVSYARKKIIEKERTLCVLREKLVKRWEAGAAEGLSVSPATELLNDDDPTPFSLKLIEGVSKLSGGATLITGILGSNSTYLVAGSILSVCGFLLGKMDFSNKGNRTEGEPTE